MNRLAEFEIKLGRVRAFLREHELDGVLLCRRPNFSWLGCGARNRVFSGAEVANGHFLVTPDRVVFMSNNIERKRWLTEELSGLPLEAREYPWYEENPARVVAEVLPEGRWATDTPFPGGRLMAGELAPLRYGLLPPEVDRYTAACRDSEEAIRSVAQTFARGESEHAIAQAIMAAAQQRGLDVVVCLAAADERISLYRHPLPTDKCVERMAMLVLGAERHGLYVSLTRLVHFGPLSPELKAKHLAVCRVDAAFNHYTTPGRAYGDVFRDGLAAYAREGFGDEWKLHHQGGPAGYQPREFKVTPRETRPVVESQGVAWNPSITGTKCEDTMLVGSGGNVFLTAARDWPMLRVEVGGRQYLRPDILVR